MASKKALKKAYDAGQAAQMKNLNDKVCPFEEGSEEFDAYMEGKSAELDEKWTMPLAPTGTNHDVALGN